MSFCPIPELLAEIRAGRMVVIVDDEDRENEGDLIMAAELVKPTDVNFMVTHARGLVCLSLTRERCRQLDLAPMVSDNQSTYHTNFTVSIEAAEGVTTGISAYDRAHTIRTAVRPDAKARDLAQPGHIFPLMAQPGGVLTRAGHTEAASDLALLAGLEPAGVLVEILNPDGGMARRPELERFAAEHGLKIGSIEEGKLADIVIADIDGLHQTPVFNIYSHLVYATKSFDVRTVVINGRIVMQNRRLLTLNENAIKTEAIAYRKKIIESLKN